MTSPDLIFSVHLLISYSNGLSEQLIRLISLGKPIFIMIGIGIFGASGISRKHIEQLLADERFVITGISGTAEKNAEELAQEYGIPFSPESHSLIETSDLIDITCCNEQALHLAREAVRNFRHVFLDCAMEWPPEEIRMILKLAREAGVRAGIRRLKRQKRVFQNAKKYINLPQIIDIQVSAQDSHFMPERLHSILFQSIDLLLLINPAIVKKISTKAVSMYDGSIGAADVSLAFDNGALAHFSFNRLLTKDLDTLQIFMPEGALKIDFLNNLAGYLPYKSASRFTIPSFDTSTEIIPESMYNLMSNRSCDTLTNLDEIYPSIVLTHETLAKIWQRVT